MKVLIVDDEPLARRGVRVCLRRAPDVEVIGECSSGQEALQKCEQLRPDLIFLDIQMPGMSGLDVAERLSPSLSSLVIFLTAHDEFALNAFAVHAVDYVLKPIHDGRFAEALEVARRRFHDKQAGAMMANIRRLLGTRVDGHKPSMYVQKLVEKIGSRTLYISVSKIDWIESAGDYVALHVGHKTHLVRKTLDGLERQMDPAQFVRIHRSTIVARKQIKQVRSLPSRDASIVLTDGTELRASRRYRKSI